MGAGPPEYLAKNSQCGTAWIADQPKTMDDYNTDVDGMGMRDQAVLLENSIVQANEQNNTCIVARDKANELPRGLVAAGVAMLFLGNLRSPLPPRRRDKVVLSKNLNHSDNPLRPL